MDGAPVHPLPGEVEDDPPVKLTNSMIGDNIRRVKKAMSTFSAPARSSGWGGDDSVTLFDKAPETIDVEHATCRQSTRMIVESRRFEVLVATMIVLNGSVMGWQADWEVRHVNQRLPTHFPVLEYMFSVAFTVELLLHIYADGIHAYCPKHRNFFWTSFDTFVVACSWVEDIVLLFHGSALDTKNLASMRAVRTIRLVRILRIIRVMRFFKELRTMVQGILASIKPLIWCLVLLGLVMFCFGILILQVVLEILKASDSAETTTQLQSYWGGIIPTVYSLYTCITGGSDWDTVAGPLIQLEPMMGPCFVLYIAFAVFCVLNIVTGVFVESANAITSADADLMIMDELNQHRRRELQMRTVFIQAVGSADESLSFDQWVSFCQNEKVRAYFRRIGISVERENAEELFNLMDEDQKGDVSIQEFVDGCFYFKGDARQLDMARLMRSYSDTSNTLKEVVSFQRDMAALHQRIAHIKSVGASQPNHVALRRTRASECEAEAGDDI